MEAGSKGLVLPDDRLHLQEINDAHELVFGAPGQLKDEGLGAKPLLHHFNSTKEVSPDPVHLVDESNFGNLVLVSLVPNRFRLGLHASYSAENADSAVEDSQDRSTSMVKSTWPGVSMILIL